MKQYLDALIRKKYAGVINVDEGYYVTIYTPFASCQFLDTKIENSVLWHYKQGFGNERHLLFEAMESIYIDPITQDCFEIKVPPKYFLFIKAQLTNS